MFGPAVAVPDALEVARRRERQRHLAVAQREQRQLVALQELLDHDGRVAEAALDQHRLQRRARLRLVLGDHHALAGRQAVGLDHRRVAGDRVEPGLDGLDDGVAAGRDAGGPMTSLANALEPSSRAAAATGRSRRRPRPRRRRRGRPPAAPPAPPRRDRRPRRRSARAPRRRRPRTASAAASRAMPGLPGAHSSSGRWGERASARTIACSRPPAPTTRTFTRQLRATR